MKEASKASTPTDFNFRRSIDPPPPAPSYCNGHGEHCPQLEQYLARAAKGAAEEGAAAAISQPKASPLAKPAKGRSGKNQ